MRGNIDANRTAHLSTPDAVGRGDWQQPTLRPKRRRVELSAASIQYVVWRRRPARRYRRCTCSPTGGGPAYQGGGYPNVVPAQYCGDCAEDGGGYNDGYGDCYDGGGGCGNCGDGGCGYGNCYGDGNGDYYGDENGYGAYGGHRLGNPCHYGNCGSWQDCRSGTNPPFPDDVENYSGLPCDRTEQCGPHYFDVRMEAVYMTRDETFKQQVDFTSENVAGPIRLSSGQLDFEPTTGFRILGRYDIGPLAVIEFGYWGIENLDSSASFTDPNPVDPDTGNLYSLFTNFVRNPALLPPTVTTPGGALPWTERSITHSISLESELHNARIQLPPLLGRLQPIGLRHVAGRLPLHPAAGGLPVPGDGRSRGRLRRKHQERHGRLPDWRRRLDPRSPRRPHRRGGQSRPVEQPLHSRQFVHHDDRSSFLQRFRSTSRRTSPRSPSTPAPTWCGTSARAGRCGSVTK